MKGNEMEKKQYYLRSTSLRRADIFIGTLINDMIVGGNVRNKYHPYEVYLVPDNKVDEVKTIIADLQKNVNSFVGNDIQKAMNYNACDVSFGEQIRATLYKEVNECVDNDHRFEDIQRMQLAGNNRPVADIDF